LTPLAEGEIEIPTMEARGKLWDFHEVMTLYLSEAIETKKKQTLEQITNLFNSLTSAPININ
jgi:hypothetical protein